jgi:predicted HicB family RNase H-like nuclease
MKNNTLEYQQYIAKLDFDFHDQIIVGKVINTNDIISFHGENLKEAISAFHDVIDAYLENCKNENIEPSKTYSGKFNLRISPELHHTLYNEAAKAGVSLNTFTVNIICDKLGTDISYN